jgi:hypothetical protein
MKQQNIGQRKHVLAKKARRGLQGRGAKAQEDEDTGVGLSVVFSAQAQVIVDAGWTSPGIANVYRCCCLSGFAGPCSTPRSRSSSFFLLARLPALPPVRGQPTAGQRTETGVAERLVEGLKGHRSLHAHSSLHFTINCFKHVLAPAAKALGRVGTIDFSGI